MITFSTNSWIIAAALATVGIFVVKIGVSIGVELLRRKHLRIVLKVYIERFIDGLSDAHENFDLAKVEEKIKREEGFMPYALYDDITEGLSIRDILLNYSFLDDKTMGKVVGCMIAENYLHSIYKEMRTEYVRSFSPKRKIMVARELEIALKDAVQQSKKAHDALTLLIEQTFFQKLLKYRAIART